jgi:hypothetical protein
MCQPFSIQRDGVYDDGQVRLALDLPEATLRRERREGRLRYIRKAGRVFYLGSWLMEWLESEAAQKSGEVAHA